MRKLLSLSGCVPVVLAFFAAAFFASYFAFRVREFVLSVHLFPVQFQNELNTAFQVQGELKPYHFWAVRVNGPARVDRLLAKPRDSIKKEQVIAIVNEAENHAALEAALKKFKEQGTALARANPPSKEAKSEYEKSKRTLLVVREKTEKSLVRSPVDGLLWLGDTQEGKTFQSGDTLAQIEDISKLVFSARVPTVQAKSLSSLCKVHLANGKQEPITVEAEVHYSSARAENSGEETSLDLVFPVGVVPLSWLHQTVQGELVMPTLRNVALIDRKAVISRGQDQRIVVLNASGTLRWRNVSQIQIHNDKLVINGVDAKTFWVVAPEDPENLSKAIALNIRPKVKGNG